MIFSYTQHTPKVIKETKVKYQNLPFTYSAAFFNFGWTVSSILMNERQEMRGKCCLNFPFLAKSKLKSVQFRLLYSHYIFLFCLELISASGHMLVTLIRLNQMLINCVNHQWTRWLNIRTRRGWRERCWKLFQSFTVSSAVESFA